MSSDWIRSVSAGAIFSRMAERRPAWLWTPDGETLIWRNPAARLFMAKRKKHKSRQPKEAIPIKGQVRRLMRLGTLGLPSLARVRFLIGQKPVSATCTCIPLHLESGEQALLIVGVEKIEKSLFRNLELPDPIASSLFENHNEHLFFDEKGRVFSGSEHALHEWGSKTFKPGGKWRAVLDAGETGFGLALRETNSSRSDVRPSDKAEGAIAPDISEQKTKTKKTGKHGPVRVKSKSTSKKQLSGLLDQLADRPSLFAPLGLEVDGTEQTTPTETANALPGAESGTLETENTPSQNSDQWRVTGRGFIAKKNQSIENKTSPLSAAETGNTDKTPVEVTNKSGSEPIYDRDVDRVARYNFDELSRLLKDRVDRDGEAPEKTPLPPEPLSRKVVAQTETAKHKGTSDKTIKLSEELLVLNRLPVGILIFRNQSILFANRALADIMGSPSIARLREGGLDAIFPKIDDESAILGPVAHLLDMNGQEVPVRARLQTIVWQGRPALMLSAQRDSSLNTDGELNIKAFVRAQAAAQNEGYFEADGRGIITQVSKLAAQLLEKTPSELVGKTLRELTDERAQKKLAYFLAQPAKFAETARPNIRIQAMRPLVEINLFTQGRAGLVSGYFGTVGKTARPAKPASGSDNRADIDMLKRLSREIRRPLNSIVGFSELVQSEAFGKQENQRYREYARDIKSAGLEISRLVDEIDEYVRLESEDKFAEALDFNLGELLDECLRLVRRQANHQQVFVRSAISEDIRSVSADRATMRQAILNLLASAIDQSPPGGKVILSAQVEPDGSVGVHVRNSDTHPGESEDRFVVFREGDTKRRESAVPLKSSMGLTLTRSLLAVNECSLSIDPSAGTGTLMTLVIPAERISEKG